MVSAHKKIYPDRQSQTSECNHPKLCVIPLLTGKREA